MPKLCSSEHGEASSSNSFPAAELLRHPHRQDVGCQAGRNWLPWLAMSGGVAARAAQIRRVHACGARSTRHLGAGVRAARGGEVRRSGRHPRMESLAMSTPLPTPTIAQRQNLLRESTGVRGGAISTRSR